MNQPDPMNIQIERLVTNSDISTEAYSGLMLLAPWEILVIEKSNQLDRYGVHWCCPRCLDVGSLNGHALDLKAPGVQATTGEDSPIHISPRKLDLLQQADSGEFAVEVNPSIGCRGCGFHCYLEGSTYRVLSDWEGDDGRKPSAVFTNRLQKLHEHRPDAYQRLAELVEGDHSA